MTALREDAFQASVIEAAGWLGWSLIYHTFDSRRSEYGWPDLVLVKPPRLVIAELKTEKGQPSPEQCEWLEALQHCTSVETHLWRPSDWDQLTGVLGADPQNRRERRLQTPNGLQDGFGR